jgi:mRNA interferase MazF
MNRGDVVLVDWPYSDRTGSKIRPAVVVQADGLNGLIEDTVLVAITRKSRGAPAVEVAINPTVDTASGLPHASVTVCNNLLTFDQRLIRRTVGSLSDATMRRINACLKTALELP